MSGGGGEYASEYQQWEQRLLSTEAYAGTGGGGGGASEPGLMSATGAGGGGGGGASEPGLMSATGAAGGRGGGASEPEPATEATPYGDITRFRPMLDPEDRPVYCAEDDTFVAPRSAGPWEDEERQIRLDEIEERRARIESELVTWKNRLHP